VDIPKLKIHVTIRLNNSTGLTILVFWNELLINQSPPCREKSNAMNLGDKTRNRPTTPDNSI